MIHAKFRSMILHLSTLAIFALSAHANAAADGLPARAEAIRIAGRIPQSFLAAHRIGNAMSSRAELLCAGGEEK